MVCVPLATSLVCHTSSYGAASTSGPVGTPSMVNCTPATPKSSVAAASTATVPVTVVPSTGVVSATAGASLSLATVTLTSLVLSFPAASPAIAVNTWLPLGVPPDFHVASHGSDVCSRPSSL